MSQTINRRDLDFLIYEMLDVESLCVRGYFSGQGRDIFDPMLDLAEDIARDHFLACAEAGDKQPAQLVDGKVRMVPETQAAMDNLYEAGFVASCLDAEHGGLQLPVTVANACMALFQAANTGLCGLPFLSVGVANLINAYGSAEQKALYIPPLLNGRFYGTMCLSEPHAGSSLTDIRTRAELQEDGSYRITGNKMWITGGEHELSENIIHMVLAKIPGGPPGVKGISLFIIPRYRVDADGNAGESNDVSLAGLNHKMGQCITPNCALNFGENGGCTGYLVGEPHRGLEYMFLMMNEARIGVGLAAVGTGYAGYRYSLEYARERAQGRLPDNKDPANKMVPIIRHADVKRMLLAQKAYVEGGLALCLFASWLVDEEKTHSDEEVREESALLLDVLVPIVKAWCSDWCLEANKHAIQILGGYGYTRDFPVERLYRDNRINMIHEGTSGIHGIDLLGRKVMMKNGAGFRLLVRKIQEDIDTAEAYGSLSEYAAGLNRAVATVTETTEVLAATAASGEMSRFLANSSAYLDMLGHAVVAWMWLKQAAAAQAGLPAAEGADRQFYEGKMQACRYFFRWELPKTQAQAELLSGLDTTCLDMPEEAF